MTPYIVKTLRKRLPKKDAKDALERIAKGSRVPYHTVLKIVNGVTSNPRVLTVERLLRYLDQTT